MGGSLPYWSASQGLSAKTRMRQSPTRQSSARTKVQASCSGSSPGQTPAGTSSSALQLACKPRTNCLVPNSCKLSTDELGGESIRMHTCMRCPNKYPWLNDPTEEAQSIIGAKIAH